MTATAGAPPAQLAADPSYRGRLVESAVGAHLADASAAGECEVYYWRDGNLEVDFVVRRGRRLLAVEVKSGPARGSISGLQAFLDRHAEARPLLVGGDGVPVEEFLASPVETWFPR
jgi:predicted AAA+ superfamily ATPase